MLVKEYISLYLNKKNLNQCFGLSGANIEDLLFEIDRNNSNQFILAKTEYSAAAMALGYYLATQKITAVLTTSGPGIFNTIPVLAESYASQIPFVLIAGMTPQEHEGIGGFQDCSGKNQTINILNTVQSVSEYAVKISDPDQIITELKKAFEIAEETKKPTVILIPKNIFNQEIKLKESDSKISNKKIIELNFSNLDSPLFILGENLIHLKDKSIIESLTKIDTFHFLTTPNAKGLISPNAKNYLGVCGVMGVEQLPLKQFKSIVLLGTNFDLTTRFGLEPLLANNKIVHVNQTDTHLEKIFPTLEIEKYIYNLNAIAFKLPQANINIEKNEQISLADNDISKAISIIEQKTHDENIFCDAGNAGAFVINQMKINSNQLFHCSLGMGGMGNSIGMSLGASLGNKKRSIALMGDGSFYFFGFEIHTAIQYNIPITFIIFNNNSHAMCSTREQVFLNAETNINHFKNSYLGKGFECIFPGVQTFEIDTLQDLDNALNTCLNSLTPNIIAINVEKNIFPPFKTFNNRKIK